MYGSPTPNPNSPYTNVMYNLQQNFLITIILKDKKHTCVSYILTVEHWSNESTYQFRFFDIGGFPPNAKWAIESLGNKEIIKSLWTQSTIDHPDM